MGQNFLDIVPVPLKAENKSGAEVGSLASCWLQLGPLRLGSTDLESGLLDRTPGYSTIGLREFWLENGEFTFNSRDFRFDCWEFGFSFSPA